MKIKLLFILFIFQSAVYAQNWSIINSTDKFNYRLDGDSIITSTIWADSILVNGSDTTFFMNRVLCDSCITILNSPLSSCNSCYGYKNAPRFLQRKIHFDGTTYNLIDTANWVIHPLASLNDSWLFDSTMGTIATVINISTDSIFQSVDSVKKILLSTGDSIVLSKNYGILIFPDLKNSIYYYRLAGIEGRNLGEAVPNFSDFYNFSIGDRFEFHTYSIDGDLCTEWHIYQYTINSKIVTGDSVQYFFSGVQEGMRSGGSPWTGPCSFNYWFGHYNGNLLFIDSTDHFTNKYNRQPFNLSNHLWGLPCTANDTAYEGVRMGLDSNNVLFKSFGFPIGPYAFGEYSQINRNSDTLFISGGVYHAVYKAGLGRTQYDYTPCFEGGNSGILTAYSKNNQTFGVFTDSTSILTGTFIPEQYAVKVFPNPAIGILYINHFSNGRSTIQLINSMGNIVKTAKSQSSDDEIAVEDLANGIYIVRIIADKRIETKKVLIAH